MHLEIIFNNQDKNNNKNINKATGFFKTFRKMCFRANMSNNLYKNNRLLMSQANFCLERPAVYVIPEADKSLKSLSPCYSQSPLQLFFEISIPAHSRNLLQFLQFSYCTAHCTYRRKEENLIENHGPFPMV